MPRPTTSSRAPEPCWKAARARRVEAGMPPAGRDGRTKRHGSSSITRGRRAPAGQGLHRHRRRAGHRPRRGEAARQEGGTSSSPTASTRARRRPWPNCTSTASTAMKVLADLGTLCRRAGADEQDGRRLWPDRRAGQQRRRHDLDQAVSSLHRGRSQAGAGAFALSDAVVLPRRAAGHDEAAIRLDRESRFAIDARALPAALCGEQGRHPGADQGAGDGIRPLRHPHQRDGAGRHRDFRPRHAAAVHQARRHGRRGRRRRPNTAARWPRTSAISRRCGGAACPRSRPPRSRSLRRTTRASSPGR